MAPWSSNKSTSTTNNPQDPAKTTFHTFANNNLAALTSNLTSLPGFHSAAENPKVKSQLQNWQNENIGTIKKLHAEFPTLFDALLSSPFRKPGQGSEVVTPDHLAAARLLLLQARNANTGTTDPDKIISLYQDHGENMLPGSGPYPIRASGTGSWLGIEWFRKSPYSPVQLEQHEYCHQHGSMWRAAFEDLLAATLDKKPVARAVWEGSDEDENEGEALYKAWGAPGMDWMLGLQVRGLLPPQLPSLYNISQAEKKKLDRVFGKVVLGKDLWTSYGKSVKREVEKLARVIASPELSDLAVKVEGPESELELYEHFLEEERKEKEKEKEEHGSEKDRSTNVDRFQPFGKVYGNINEEAVEVTAALTTTETTVLPDGSTHSRRVLKKRFADGREETKEEELSSQDGGRAGKSANAGDKDKSGWFWT